MKLQLIAGDPCTGGQCPAVYLSDRGTVVVQGAKVSDAHDLDLPSGEVLAEVPLSLLHALLQSGRLG